MNNDVKQDYSRYAQLKESIIMLVDDEPVMLEIVQALLEEEGYQHFISVEDSTLAIEELSKGNPDILLLDLDMPEVDGFEVLSGVRALKHFEYLPVVILTASEDPSNKLRALEMGATDFLSKPVDASELALRVRNTLAAKAYQDQLAYYDNLTGLPNRKLFIERLGRGISLAKREKQSLVLLDISLDRFRYVNETMGLYVGDYVLKTVAERINAVIRSSDVFTFGGSKRQLDNMARIGGDEFSIVLCGVDSVANAGLVCKRVLETVKQPFSVEEEELFLTASIGISVYPDDGEDVETLVKHAGSAKDYAKAQGRDNFQYYSSEMNEHTRALMKMEAELRKALDKEEFKLFYQPKIDTHTGKVMGMESLIRWFHPEDGLVSPVVFIPIAEEKGLIIPIGNWVLKEACSRASEWIAQGHDLKVSVNVSVVQFGDAGFKNSVVDALQCSGLDPKYLILEITESMLMGDVEHFIRVLQDIKDLGVSFSLDDFGTGYSSLSYLKRFPISELKIDRSFLIDVPANMDDSSIVKAIIAMAHSLGQKVVAEGVENREQLDFLTQYNCDIIQGFYFNKPLSQDDFSYFLKLKDK